MLNYFLENIIWNSWVLTKVSCLFFFFFFFGAYEVCWAKVLTFEQLQRKDWSLANRHHLCNSEMEFTDHILFQCPRARELWNLCFTLIGVA